MANYEHKEMLKTGVARWNTWRRKNVDIRPDLEFANFRDEDLSNANLRNANLVGACFEKANLSGVDLAGSDLRDALLSSVDLSDAVLSRASLVNANLESANLRNSNLGGTRSSGPYLVDDFMEGATLKGANLRRANLRKSNLGGVNLSDAELEETDFAYAWMVGTIIDGVDLSKAKGLAEIRHVSASTIGTLTMRQTANGLSVVPFRQAEVEIFLRGAGVPESVLDVFRGWIGKPIDFYSCFISYSHSDRSFARRFFDQCQNRGIRCWLDEHRIEPGERILDVINTAIRIHDKVLLCCSEISLNSWWVKDEIRKAHERERRDGRDIIIPLDLDGYLLQGWEDGLAADLRARLAADFTGWEHNNAKFEEQFERVVKALRTDQGAREKPPKPKL